MSLPPDAQRLIDDYTSVYGPHYRYPSGESPADYLLSDAGRPSYDQSRNQQDLERRVTAGELGFGRLHTRHITTSTSVTSSIARNWPDADEIYYWDMSWEAEINPIFSPIVEENEFGSNDLRDDVLKCHPICPFLLYNFEVGFWWTPSFRHIFRAHITSSRKTAFMYRIMDAYAEMALHKGYPKQNADGERMHYPFTAFLKFFGVEKDRRRLTATRGITLPPPKCMMHLMDAHMMLNIEFTEHYNKWRRIYRKFNDYLDKNDLDHHDPRDTPEWRRGALDSVTFVWNNFIKDN